MILNELAEFTDTSCERCPSFCSIKLIETLISWPKSNEDNSEKIIAEKMKLTNENKETEMWRKIKIGSVISAEFSFNFLLGKNICSVIIASVPATIFARFVSVIDQFIAILVLSPT